MVACVVFGGMLAFVLLIQRVGQDAYTKTDVHSETFRKTINALDRLRKELQGARVDDVSDDKNVLTFASPLLDHGQVQVTASGYLKFAAPSVIRTDGAGIVTLTVGTDPPKTLARLGPGGGLWFELRPGNLLHVKARAVIEDPDNRAIRESAHEAESEIFLLNQPVPPS